MNTITNPEVVRFVNEVLRALADRLASVVPFLDLVNDKLNASGNTLLADLGSDSTALIDDGSLVGGMVPGSPDGRVSVSVGDCLLLIQTALRLKAQADSDVDPVTGLHTGRSSRSLFDHVAVNPNL